jgi:adenylylsulfate kinase
VGAVDVQKSDGRRQHATRKRSALKALSYRVVIVSLDFTVVYLLTGKTKVAVGFMIFSNIYTTVAYFLHERLWARVTWGVVVEPSPSNRPRPIPSQRDEVGGDPRSRL